jgi:hypothetical protein
MLTLALGLLVAAAAAAADLYGQPTGAALCPRCAPSGLSDPERSPAMSYSPVDLVGYQRALDAAEARARDLLVVTEPVAALTGRPATNRSHSWSVCCGLGRTNSP